MRSAFHPSREATVCPTATHPHRSERLVCSRKAVALPKLPQDRESRYTGLVIPLIVVAALALTSAPETVPATQEEVLTAVEECDLTLPTPSQRDRQFQGIEVDRKARLMWAAGDQGSRALDCLKRWAKEHKFGLIIVHR